MMLIEKIAEASINATHFQNWDPSTDAAGQFAVGGVVKGPVNAILGETGPEVVVPMKKKFMNKKVKDVVRHFKSREMLMRKSAAKKKKDRRIKAIGKGKISHGGYDESSGGALVPNSSLGNRQLDSPSSGYGGQMGSLAAGGPPISGSVRAGSQVNLR